MFVNRRLSHGVFSRAVTTAMLVSPTHPPGIELYYYANVFFCLGGNKVTDHVSENTLSLLR